MLDKTYYNKADEVIAVYGRKPASLIPIMQDIQAEYRYLPGELLNYVADEIGVTRSRASRRTAHLCGWKNWGNGSKSLQCCDLLREFFL